MKLIHRPRGGGKTTAIVEMMMDNRDAACLVADAQRACALEARLRVAGHHPGAGRVWTAMRLRNGDGTSFRRGEVVVDDLDDVLHALLGIDVAAATLSGPLDSRLSLPSQPGPFIPLLGRG